MVSRWVGFLLGLLFGGLLLQAMQNSDKAPAETEVPRTKQGIIIDGVLEEPAWRRAPSLPLQDIKGRKAPATTAKLLWDDKNLYIAFDCADTDIWATKKQRDDFLWEEEVVEVFIDPDGDGRNYYEFQVNPLGTQIDLLIPDAIEGVKDAKRNAQWNCKGWRSAVKVRGTVNQHDDTDEGWTVEMAIPLTELVPPSSPFFPRLGVVWRLNLYRIDRPKGQEKDPLLSAWSPCQRWFHEPEHFGRVKFTE
ncbi:MAG: hypothetical protein SLRJCFUN_000610 [Candidatus Fervidibacter sp.]